MRTQPRRSAAEIRPLAPRRSPRKATNGLDRTENYPGSARRPRALSGGAYNALTHNPSVTRTQQATTVSDGHGQAAVCESNGPLSFPLLSSVLGAPFGSECRDQLEDSALS
jgi:hypothetical protein